MVIKAYLDESVSYESKEEKIIVAGGFVALKDEWSKFADQWRCILDKNKIQNFHFNEFHRKTPEQAASAYTNWTDDQRDEFFYDLAMVIAERLIPVGGSYNIKKHRDLNLPSNPFERVFEQFFSDLRVALAEHWPKFTGGDFENKVLCIYDKTTNPNWVNAVQKVYKSISQHDSRFGGLSFESDEDPKHLGLQAADFYCGVFRQASERQLTTEKRQDYRIIDIIVTRLMREKSHPWSLANMSPFTFKVMIDRLREDSKRQKAEWAKREGGKQVYYPLQHHPLAQRLGQSQKLDFGA